MTRFSLGRDDDDDDDDFVLVHSDATSRQPPTKRIRIEIPFRPTSTTVTNITSTTSAAGLQENNGHEETFQREEEFDYAGDDVLEVGDTEDAEQEDEAEEDDARCDASLANDDNDDESDRDEKEEGNEGFVEVSTGADVNGGGGSSGNRSSVLVTLTDPDVFDCPICLDSLTVPIFQCENGHVACASCCLKINNKCPSCSWPIGYNRCRAMEKIIESVKVSCVNFEFGCKERMPYSQKQEHENSCVYAPCSCPIDHCAFVGPLENLYAHFDVWHTDTAERFHFNCLFPVYLEKIQGKLILQEQTDSTIFILNQSSERLGYAFNVICIGSTPSKKRYYYDIIARDGNSKLQLQSEVETIPKLSPSHPLRKYLLVPSSFLSRSYIKLELCIWRHPESTHLLEDGKCSLK